MHPSTQKLTECYQTLCDTESNLCCGWLGLACKTTEAYKLSLVVHLLLLPIL